MLSCSSNLSCCNQLPVVTGARVERRSPIEPSYRSGSFAGIQSAPIRSGHLKATKKRSIVAVKAMSAGKISCLFNREENHAC